jgi:hypothetical protein
MPATEAAVVAAGRRWKTWQVALVAILAFIIGIAAGSSTKKTATTSATGTTVAENTTLAPTTTVTTAAPTTTTARPTTTTTAPRGPRQVGQFTGSSSKQTPTFTIDPDAKSWTIAWNMTGSDNNNITLKHPPDEYDKLVVNEIGPTKDQSQFYTTGTYFLDVGGSGSWSITVTESFT